MIITEYVPAGWNFITATPINASSFDSATGKVQWVLYGASFESQTITYTVSVPETATGDETFNGQVLYNDEEGTPVTDVTGGDTESASEVAKRRLHYFVVNITGDIATQPITVTVTDKDTGKVISGVGIDVYLNNKKVVYGQTNDKGIFTFTPTEAGKYEITVEKSRYRDKAVTITVITGATTTTTIKATTTTVIPITTTTLAPVTLETTATITLSGEAVKDNMVSVTLKDKDNNILCSADVSVKTTDIVAGDNDATLAKIAKKLADRFSAGATGCPAYVTSASSAANVVTIAVKAGVTFKIEADVIGVGGSLKATASIVTPTTTTVTTTTIKPTTTTVKATTTTVKPVTTTTLPKPPAPGIPTWLIAVIVIVIIAVVVYLVSARGKGGKPKAKEAKTEEAKTE